MNIWRTGALAAMLWLFATGANAQSPGVFVDNILFGQSAALGGPAADLGTEMRRGILAAFEESEQGRRRQWPPPRIALL